MRRAYLLRLREGGLPGYVRHHDAIWPDLVAEIERQGIATMSVWAADPVLVLVADVADPDALDRLWATEVHRRWGDVMAQYMAYGEDGAIEAVPLTEVFRLETAARVR